ncbi:MAG TPA: SpoIIE family protein phosphatase [Thermoleophilaceae bacterium]|nr:SpoIIE family protein phosphatase [Thermoleophilaceae bacterium]
MADSPELFSRALMARSLAYLFTGGALVGCLTLAFPHDAAVDDGPLYALAALAVTIGLVVLWRAESMPTWGMHLALATGSVILAAANYFVGPSGLYLIIFTWTGLYAFYFYRPPVALAHLAVIAVSYLVVLIVQDPPSPVVRWVLAVGTPGLAGLMVSTLLDRVRRETAQTALQEQGLRESEARTRAIVDSAPEPFLGVSEEGTVVSWNPAAERTFGWSAEEAVGQPIRDLIVAPENHEDHRRRREEEFARHDGETRPSQREVELVRRDGERFLAEITYSRVRAGDRPMLACFIRDISDRQEREREREQLYREQAAREEAEQMAGIVHGLQMLLDVALAHNRLDDMLAALLPRVCEVVNADGAAVLLAEEDGSLTLRASMFRDVETEPLRIELGEGIAGRVARDKQPLLVQDPDPSEIADPALYGLHSILGVPLMAGGEVAGVLKVGVPAPRRFSEDDLMVLGLAADRVALAIDHLRIYEREHKIAEMLQRSLLPDRLPNLPGLEVAARYEPAASESEVGGDWYDVIAMPGGRVGLVMGDVAGKGLAAASMVGRLRSAMRAYTLEGHRPAEVVDRLNQLVWSEIEASHMTTMVYVVFDPLAGTITWVNAGHLPPLAVTSDGIARFLEGPSSVPLGVMSYPAYEEAETEMPLGGTVLLYTDGLVERPGELLDHGLGRLVAAVRGERVGPQELCDLVVERLVPTAGASDDVALLALCSPPLADTFQLELGSEPGELAALRALLRRWLRNGDGDETEIAEILTATGEAAANAIEHGGSIAGGPPFEVTGRLDGGEVEIVVRDSGGWRERQRSEGGRGLVLMRALMDSVDVDRRPNGTTVTMRRTIGAGVPTGA